MMPVVATSAPEGNSCFQVSSGRRARVSFMHIQHDAGSGRIDHAGIAVLYVLLDKIAQIPGFDIRDIPVRTPGDFGRLLVCLLTPPI